MSKKNIMEQMHDLIRTKGNTPIIWGYTRVSSLEQSLERQKIELEDYGVDYILEEKASGKNFKDRNIYNLLIKNTRKGDKIICTSLDRFSRSVRETVKELELLEKKGVTVIFLKEKIDTSQTGISQLMLNIFSWVAEQERLTMLERQKKGYEALQKNEKGRLISKKGTIIGAKEKKFTNKQLELIKEYKNGKSIYNLSQLARLINVSRPTLYKKIKELTN
ncbi:recombinase family protein [Fusobacterium polymorphum]|uniref:recombinase family protein n=1 Tax=Fusobacterium nucleatum subsp. polymorphum TaxID=76857 RepID=UPI001C6E7EE5|nr:recombinase family protein [Fusobacterium polymorphum]QYR60243.1 recombinase family protein [Fusobacterium polymorphum]